MRAKSVLGVALAFGVAFALVSGSGIGAAVFGEAADNAETTRTLDEISNNSDVDPDSEGDGFSADVTGDQEPTIVGAAISGGQFVVQLVSAVALLPVTLTRLGFPAYFAFPLGGVAQIVAFVGLAQFVTGRELI